MQRRTSVEAADHPVVRAASAIAERISDEALDSLKELEADPERLFEQVAHQYPTADWAALNREVDTVSWAMGCCAVLGFMAHDAGRLAAADAYFFAKDANMFAYPLSEGELTPAEILTGSVAYRELLGIKDCLEWANLSRRAKRMLAADSELSLSAVADRKLEYYLDLGTRQLYEELSSEQKRALGVRDVDTVDFQCGRETSSDPWQPLLDDKEGHQLLEAKAKQRATALGLSSNYSERWFISHKSVESYMDGCCVARYAELAGATLFERFDQQARVFDRGADRTEKRRLVDESMKPSDGVGGPGALALYYGLSVEHHDMKSGISLRRIPHEVAVFYKATQLRRVVDDTTVTPRDVRNFGQSFDLPVDDGLESWQAFLEWCEGAGPLEGLQP